MSRTVRLTQSSTDSAVSSRIGPSVILPWLGFRPTSPQHEAGMRMEPPPSLACANGTMPLATAAAAPPLDPPGERLVSHGLWVAPQASGSVVGTLPSSGLLVRPAITKPAVAVAADQSGVGVRDHLLVLERDVAVADGLTGIAGEQVFDEERHATERPVGQLSPGCVAGMVEPADHHGVEHGVDALDALDAASSSSSGVTSPFFTKAAWSTASIQRVSSASELTRSV